MKQDASQRDSMNEGKFTADCAKRISQKVNLRDFFTEKPKHMDVDYDRKL